LTSPAPIEDGNLPCTLRKIGEAIRADRPETLTVHRDDGATSIEWLDSLYVQFVEAVLGEKHRTGVFPLVAGFEPRPPHELIARVVDVDLKHHTRNL
jgi:hypothetical protein